MQHLHIKPISTEADYRSALKEIARLMESDPELGTPNGDRLDQLSDQVLVYEATHDQASGSLS